MAVFVVESASPLKEIEWCHPSLQTDDKWSPNPRASNSHKNRESDASRWPDWKRNPAAEADQRDKEWQEEDPPDLVSADTRLQWQFSPQFCWFVRVIPGFEPIPPLVHYKRERARFVPALLCRIGVKPRES